MCVGGVVWASVFRCAVFMYSVTQLLIRGKKSGRDGKNWQAYLEKDSPKLKPVAEGAL